MAAARCGLMHFLCFQSNLVRLVLVCAGGSCCFHQHVFWLPFFSFVCLIFYKNLPFFNWSNFFIRNTFQGFLQFKKTLNFKGEKKHLSHISQLEKNMFFFLAYSTIQNECAEKQSSECGLSGSFCQVKNTTCF